MIDPMQTNTTTSAAKSPADTAVMTLVAALCGGALAGG